MSTNNQVSTIITLAFNRNKIVFTLLHKSFSTDLLLNRCQEQPTAFHQSAFRLKVILITFFKYEDILNVSILHRFMTCLINFNSGVGDHI